MRWCACTIASRRMLPSARVVARSFAQHHPEIDVYTLLADDPGPREEDRDDVGVLLGLDDLGRPGLRDRAFRLGEQEFSYALTPALLTSLLERGYDSVVFYKQESLVVGRQDAAIARLATCDALLTPHLLAPLTGADATDRERTILLSGVYNLGFLGVRDRPGARALLDWWDERLARECTRDVAEGLHFEQRWMDLAPSLFDGVEALRDPAFNVGHWNVTEREMTADPDGHDVRVDGRPCALVRFSGYDPQAPERMTRYVDRVPVPALRTGAAVVARYRRELLAAGWAAAQDTPYGFDRFADGVRVPPVARRLHRELDAEPAAALGDPFACGAGTFRAWVTERVDDQGPAVSRLMLAEREHRPDLVDAYPDPTGADRVAFASWWARHRDEHRVPVELDPTVAVRQGPAAVTVVTRDRLAHARVLAASLRRHAPDLPFFVLLIGDGGPDPVDEPFDLVPRHCVGSDEIERLVLDGAWADAAGRAKAAAMLAALHAGHDRVVYLDADTEALGALDPLLDAAARHELVLVPHALEPLGTPPDVAADLLLLVAGTFNAGVLAVRAGSVATAFLEWWGARTAAGRAHGPSAGVFHDQRWLDLAPSLFDGVGVLRDPRFDVAPWNLHQRLDQDWRLVHYSGLDPEDPTAPSGHHPTLTFAGAERARARFAAYARAVRDAGWQPGGPGPPRFADGVPVPPRTGEIVDAAPRSAFDRTDLLGTGSGSLRRWLAAPADGQPDGPNNLWLGIHALRGDLQDAFPQPLGADRAAFVAWCRAPGLEEHPVDAAFALPPRD